MQQPPEHPSSEGQHPLPSSPPTQDDAQSKNVPLSSKPTKRTTQPATQQQQVKDVDVRRLHWVPDDLVTECTGCHLLFTVTLWKHHCRECGQVFCNNCTITRVRLPNRGYPFIKVRVCDDCALNQSHHQTQELSQDLNIRDQINKNIKNALAEKYRLLERCRSLLLEIESSAANHNVWVVSDNEGSSNGLLTKSNRRGSKAISTSSSIPSNSQSDDEGEGGEGDMSDSFLRLLSRTEASFGFINRALSQSVAANASLLAQLEKAQASIRSKDSLLIKLEDDQRRYLLESRAVESVIGESNTYKSIIAEQEALLFEKVEIIEGLKRRCQNLEFDKKSLIRQPSVRPRIAGTSSWNLFSQRNSPLDESEDQLEAETSKRTTTLEEPLINYYSEGSYGFGPSRNKGGYKYINDYGVATTGTAKLSEINGGSGVNFLATRRTSSGAAATVLRKCRDIMCCCCRYRRRSPVTPPPSSEPSHPPLNADSSRNENMSSSAIQGDGESAKRVWSKNPIMS